MNDKYKEMARRFWDSASSIDAIRYHRDPEVCAMNAMRFADDQRKKETCEYTETGNEDGEPFKTTCGGNADYDDVPTRGVGPIMYCKWCSRCITVKGEK